jgi:hypothetical protein
MSKTNSIYVPMNTLLKIILTISLILIASTIALAQPGLPNPPNQAPIDGGLGLLAAAGGAYAIKKLRKSSGD